MIKLKIYKLHQDAIIPSYAHSDDAAFDISSIDNILLPPSRRCLAKTGIAINIPQGYEIQIRPRSGLALKHGISIINSPGTIDAGYKGEIGVILINHGSKPFEIKKGDRIAQLVLNKVEKAKFTLVRGIGGFGSTGK